MSRAIIRTQKQLDAAKMLESALSGDRKDTNRLFEAMSTSDIPAYLEPAINKKVQEVYTANLGDWTKIARRETVDDFRLQEIVRPRFTDGTVLPENEGKAFHSGGLPHIGELDEYPQIGLSATGITYKIGKRGVKASLSWETIVNTRSLSLLEKFWNEFGVRAARQEVYEATSQFVDGSGFTTHITAPGNGNTAVLPGNPELDIDVLQTAMEQAAAHQIDGQTANLGTGFNLVVPQNLAVAARRILSITEVRDRDASGDVETVSGNPVSGLIEVVVLPEITQINPGAGKFWWIMPKPQAVEANAMVAFLRGHENPEVFIKSTTVQNPEDGDFDHDAYETKVRHTATGAWSETVGVVASNGSNT